MFTTNLRLDAPRLHFARDTSEYNEVLKTQISPLSHFSDRKDNRKSALLWYEEETSALKKI